MIPIPACSIFPRTRLKRLCRGTAGPWKKLFARFSPTELRRPKNSVNGHRQARFKRAWHNNNNTRTVGCSFLVVRRIRKLVLLLVGLKVQSFSPKLAGCTSKEMPGTKTSIQ